MDSQPFRRILFAVGIVVTCLGLYAGSQTSTEFRWDSYVSMVIIGVGVLIAVIGLIGVLVQDEAPADAVVATRRHVLPSRLIPLVFGGFIGVVALVSGLVVGHYAGRNEGFITFIFAFILANIVFGLGLALGRAPSYR
jgi:hypothetical protein